MKFVTNRCVQCGTPKRPYDLQSRHNGWLDATGTFNGTEFWFCCDDHYQEAAEHYVPREWLWSRNFSDTPEFKEVFDAHFDKDNYDQEKINRALRRAADIWNAKQRGVYDDAYSKLAERLRAEASHQRAEQAEKDRLARENEEEKQRIAQEKEDVRLEKERLAQEETEERMKPRPIPDNIRFEHTHILGGTGVGKSTLLIKHF